MRKLLLGVAMLLFGLSSFGQAVTDQAVIPVSVTLNSILRLTVTSGGNIVFVVNTVDQYTNGIPNSPRTDTKFLVSSSRNYDVTMTSESSTGFVGLETGSTDVFELGNLGYRVSYPGDDPTIPDGDPGSPSIALRQLDASFIIIPNATAGGNREYTIHWELATPGVAGLGTLGSLLAQSLPADVYVNNVFLTLSPNTTP